VAWGASKSPTGVSCRKPVYPSNKIQSPHL
jgi:hypothetical protein